MTEKLIIIVIAAAYTVNVFLLNRRMVKLGNIRKKESHIIEMNIERLLRAAKKCQRSMDIIMREKYGDLCSVWEDPCGDFEFVRCKRCGNTMKLNTENEEGAEVFKKFCDEYQFCQSCGAYMVKNHDPAGD